MLIAIAEMDELRRVDVTATSFLGKSLSKGNVIIKLDAVNF